MTPEQKMSALASTFPTVAPLAGAQPWNAKALAAHYGTASSGTRQAIAFLQTVWNPRHGLTPPFDFAEALECWDDAHWRAFAAWTARPFTC